MAEPVKLQSIECHLLTDDAEDGMKCGARCYTIPDKTPLYTEFEYQEGDDLLAALNLVLLDIGGGYEVSTTV